jgi:dTDP-4-amino-4,6-dideoxygalactose transaminase
MNQVVNPFHREKPEPESKPTLHVGRPNIGSRPRLLSRIADIVDRGCLSNNGPMVLEFEQRVAEYVGVRHCVAMCNATVALEILVRALELTGEVIVPSNTFVATAHALEWQRITPVFCDIDPATHNLDPSRIEELITPRTTGIIGVHLWGRPCPIEELTELAARRGLTLIFDAAHAFGCSQGGRMIGGFGAAEVFSFHATKFLNSGEGGAVVTNSDDLAAKLRLMRNFGFSGYDNVIYLGTNGKMHELSAALGITNFESLESFLEVNYRNYKLYERLLQQLPGVQLIAYDERERCNYQYIVLEVEEEHAGVSRDRLIELLTAERILARRYFYPGCHGMEPYRSFTPSARYWLPQTESLLRKIIVLPTGVSIGVDEVARVCGILRHAVTASLASSRRTMAEPVNSSSL